MKSAYGAFALALSALALSAPGCGDGTEDAAADTAAGIVVTIEAPAEGAVSGVVTITARAAPESLVTGLAAVTPAGLEDTDPSPTVFSAEWNTTLEPDGPVTLVIRATGDGLSAQASRTVTIDNVDGGAALSGRLLAVGPVRGADIQIFGFAGLQVGSLLGTGKTDSQGQFQANLDVPGYDDLVLVRASGAGAAYWSAATGADAALTADAQLETVVHYTDGSALSGVLVTPLTTLGVAAARGRVAVGDSPAEAVSWGMEQLRAHVFRPDPGGRDIRDVAPADMQQSALPDQATTAVALAAAGLDWMAAQQGSSLAGITRALGLDLEDAVFDGLDSTGTPIVLTGVFLSPEATRAPLAAAIHDFVASEHNATQVTSTSLAQEAGLYDDLSLDTGPLYPPGTPSPFDQEPPVVSWVHPEDAEPWRGQPFVVRVEAEDKSPPVRFALVPELPLELEEPLAAEWLLTPADLPDGELKLEVTAVDDSGNEAVSELILRLDSTPPEVVLAEGGAWTSAQSVTLQGTVTDALSGVAGVAVEVGVETFAAVLDGAEFSATFDVTDTGGATDVTLNATDHAGNTLTVPVTVQVDTSGPQITSIVPTAGTPVKSADLLTVTIIVNDPESGVAKVEAAAGEGFVLLTLDSGVATGQVPVAGPEGERELEVAATNSAGAKTAAGHLLIVDDTPPSWDGVDLGVLVGGVHMVADADVTVTLLNLQDKGPANALAEKGTMTVVGGEDAVTVAFGDTPDVSVLVTLPEPWPADINVTVSDAAGNEDSVSLPIGLDNTGPEVTFTSHTDNQWVPTDNVTVSGTATDPVGLASVTLLGGEDGTVDGSGFEVVAMLPNSAGANLIKLKAFDGLGNDSETSLTLQVDMTPPFSVELLHPGDGWPVQSGDVFVTATASDFDAPIVSLEVLVLGQTFSLTLDAEDNTAQGHVGVSAVAGSVPIELTAFNAAGLPTTVTSSVVIDNSKPEATQIFLGGEVDGVHWLPSADASISLTVIDLPEHLAWNKFTIAFSGVATGTWTKTVLGENVVIPLTLKPPANTLVMVLIDTAGNTADPMTFTVAIDEVAPSIELVWPVPNDGNTFWTNQDNATLEVFASDDQSGVQRIEVWVDNLLSVLMTPNGGGSWTADIPLGLSQSVYFRAFDYAGNPAELAPIVVSQDKALPVLAWKTMQHRPELSIANPCDTPTSVSLGTKAFFGSGDDPTFQIFAHRLFEAAEPVVFDASVVDVQLDWVHFEFRRGPMILATGNATQQDGSWTTPLTLENFASGPLAGFAWAEANIPDRIVVTARDLADNTASIELLFTLDATLPPACVQPVGALSGEPTDLANFSLDALTAHQPFQPGHAPVRLDQVRITNPYSIPLELVAQAPAGAFLQRSVARAAIPMATGEAGCQSTCLLDLGDAQCVPCNFSGNACDGFSTLAPSSPEVPPTRPIGFVLQSQGSQQETLESGLPTLAGGGWMLAPGSVSYLNVTVDLGGSCVLHPAESFAGNTLYVGGYTGCSDQGGTADHKASCTVVGPGLTPVVAPQHTPTYVSALVVVTQDLALGARLSGDPSTHQSIP
ncbi:MAG: hypothetical protein ACI9WU_002980, partial [Myxococcota bacterium]